MLQALCACLNVIRSSRLASTSNKVFTCNEVIFYELFFTCKQSKLFLFNIYFFTLFLFLYFGE